MITKNIEIWYITHLRLIIEKSYKDYNKKKILLSKTMWELINKNLNRKNKNAKTKIKKTVNEQNKEY